MASTPFPEHEPRASALGTAAAVLAVVALAWQLAYWTWVFVAPPATSPAATAAPADVDLAAVARLFGAAPPTAGAAPADAAGLRLKGVIAPTPGVAASAIFSTGAGRDLAVYIGEDVQPGVKLVEVNPDHVVVARAGERSRIDLEAPRAIASARGPAAGRAMGFKLNVARTGGNNFSLSRKELDDALRDPHQLNYLGQIGMPSRGGVRMEAAPPGSLAQKLGLQPGDVIKKVNGQVVASTGDLARLYTQFANLSLVQVEVQRGNALLQLSYAIQP